MLKHSTTANSTLKVGFPHPWGNLTPSLQHTVYADTIIKNQFEPLVRFGLTGTIEPLAAKSWTVSPDFRVFTFMIDNTRRFSDGTILTAAHFKRAWEYALTLHPKSANSSLQDMLYKVEGFEDFEKTKQLSGLVAKDNTTFEIHFKTPFRMALDRLSGGRFGVFLVKNGTYLGTGSYINERSTDTTATLVRNPYAVEKAGFDRIEVSVVDPNLAANALQTGQVDAYAHANVAAIEACAAEQGTVGCVYGDEVQHSNLYVNGLPGRFFSNPKYRLALQALIANAIPQTAQPKLLNLNGFQSDPQVFLPVQAGRLPGNEVQSIIARGTPYIPEFIAATKKTPLFYASKGSEWLFDLMVEKGVTFTKTSGSRELEELLQMGYKTSEPDLLALRSSVENGDPDGIYHFVGKHGAILLPMTYREPVGKLMEEGRSLLNRSELNAHYQKVTRAILEEVPFVHLGFNRDALAYRKDRARIVEKVKERRDLRFLLFEPL